MVINPIKGKLRILVFSFFLLIFGGICLFYFQQPGFTQSSGDNDTEVINIKRGNRNFQTNIIKEVPDPEKGRPSRAGSILVKFRKNATQVQRDQVNKKAKALKIQKLYLHDSYRVRVNKNEIAQVLAIYKDDPAVEAVEPDRIMHALDVPNDPMFGQQWGMQKINAPQAWNITSSSPDVRIAVLDCGIYDSASSYIGPDGHPGHPDIRNKVVGRINFTTASDTDDFCNHGTHVAGIAAASTNNNTGVAGAGNNADIVNVKVLGDNGSGSFEWIINGILWAAGCDTQSCGTRRAEIINMSLGAAGSCDPLLQSAIDKAWSQGLVLVAAAGNNGANGAITPANCNHVIGVSASDQNNAKASFSNYGPEVDVAAPGVNILSSNYIGSYSSFNGTSMASPHVAGLAALIWTTSYNTGNSSVVDRIIQTANVNTLAGSTYGRIDAYSSVTGNNPTPTPTDTLTPTPDITDTPSPTVIATPSAIPTLTLIPTPLICTAPSITAHSDTNPNKGGTVSFSWKPITGASTYRIQRQTNANSWSNITTTNKTNYSGNDASNDPKWRVFVYSGTCTPIPGPSTVLDP